MPKNYVTLALPLLVRQFARENHSRDLVAASTSMVVDLARGVGASSIFAAKPVRLEPRRLATLPKRFGELGGPGPRHDLVPWVDAILLTQLVLRLIAEGVDKAPGPALKRAVDPGHVLVSGQRYPAARDGTVFHALLREQRLGEREFAVKRWLRSQLEQCTRQGEVAGPLPVTSADQRRATPAGATMCLEASLYGFLLLWTLDALAHPARLRACSMCDHVFVQRHGRQVHCSDACKMRAYRARAHRKP